MPEAKPPAPPKTPAGLSATELTLIKAEVQRIFGSTAVVRNCGPDPVELWLHVEAEEVAEPRQSELLGMLYAKIDRERIGVSFTKRGSRVSGGHKIAYRQGIVL